MRIFHFMLLFLSISSGLAYSQPLTNLSILKREIVSYHSSGVYAHEVSEVMRAATTYLKEQVARNKARKKPHRLAVVFDVDETALSNYKALKAVDFSSVPLLRGDLLKKVNARSLKPVLNCYLYAISEKVSVFFVTGRPEHSRAVTLKSLKAAGYQKFKRLYMRQPNEKSYATVQDFKEAAREKIVAQGFDIVLNVGDQYSDIIGKHSRESYKLPNFIYQIN